eukprot:Nk52_evm4s533 gene=Nk52_evmTU4s533
MLFKKTLSLHLFLLGYLILFTIHRILPCTSATTSSSSSSSSSADTPPPLANYTGSPNLDLAAQASTCLDAAQGYDVALLDEFGWNPQDQYNSVKNQSQREQPPPFLVVGAQGWESNMVVNAIVYYLLIGPMYYPRTTTYLRQRTASIFASATVSTDQEDNEVWRCSEGHTHINMEFWEEGKTSTMERLLIRHGKPVGKDAGCLEVGDIGYPGRNGVYLNKQAIDANPTLIMEYFRTYSLNPAIFTGGTFESRDATSAQAKGACTQNYCGEEQKRFETSECKKNPSGCIKFYHNNPLFAAGLIESMLENNKFPASVEYVGYSGQVARIRETSQVGGGDNRPIMFYHWKPTTVVSQIGAFRLNFIEFSNTCYSNVTAGELSGVDCDFPTDIIKKIVWKGLQVYDPHSFLLVQLMSLLEEQINAILAQIGLNGQTELTAACSWLKNNRDVWKQWVPYYPSEYQFESAELDIPMGSLTEGESTSTHKNVLVKVIRTGGMRGTVQINVADTTSTVVNTDRLTALGLTASQAYTPLTSSDSLLTFQDKSFDSQTLILKVEINTVQAGTAVILELGPPIAPANGNAKLGPVSSILIRFEKPISSSDGLSSTALIIIGTSAALAALFIILLVLWYIQRLRRTRSKDWIIFADELFMPELDVSLKVVTCVEHGSPRSQFSYHSFASSTGSPRQPRISGQRATSTFCDTAMFKGMLVRTKVYPNTASKCTRFLPQTNLYEIALRRRERHPNWCYFFGICIDMTSPSSLDSEGSKNMPPTIRQIKGTPSVDNILVVEEYCSRGSISDVLSKRGTGSSNISQQSTWEFKFSLINDIIKGMLYLHNSDLLFHGNLSPGNCVVDSRFVCKLCDFGLLRTTEPDTGRKVTVKKHTVAPDKKNPFKKTSAKKKSSVISEIIHFSSMDDNVLRGRRASTETISGIFVPGIDSKRPSALYADPNLLQNDFVSSTLHSSTLQRGDVFSFGLILGEVLTDQRVYFDHVHIGRSGASNELRISECYEICEQCEDKDIVECIMTGEDIHPFNSLRNLKEFGISDNEAAHVGGDDILPKASPGSGSGSGKAVMQQFLTSAKGKRKLQKRKQGSQSEQMKRAIYDLTLLAKSCFEEKVEKRPPFTQIMKRFTSSVPRGKTDIMENMMMVLESYADTLEDMVEERTQELEGEKKLTDQLIRRMLPERVAEALRKGEYVEPETFDMVSVFFSDIVGFTEIAGKSSPLEIVELLNTLYKNFDQIIEQYDVYKVETIGDAYMVASGLPVRNGDLHISEIATMSLHLLEFVHGSLSISHMPNTKLQLRIGCHCGQVAAGVVGHIMPRYCLFGDTINIASRMESTGLPLKIHLSSEVHRLLTKLGGFDMQERGEIEVKGKGMMKTFWLTGSTRRSFKLPTDADAVDIEELFVPRMY